MRVRKFVSVGVVLTLVMGLIAAVTIVVTSHPGPPRQQTGTAAGRPHRVPASVSLGRIVNGRLVPATSTQAASGSPLTAKRPFIGPQSAAKLVPGGVPPATPPKPLHLPARGKKPAEKLSTQPVPAAAAKAGYDQKTSHEIPPTRADQIVFANADGTRTAFQFQSPVNYQRQDGTWATINTSLVPNGTVPTPSPSASAVASLDAMFGGPAAGSRNRDASPGSSESPSVSTEPGSVPSPGSDAPPTSADSTPPASATAAASSPPAISSPTATPSASGTPGASAPPASGWTQQSAAEPESFAGYADAPDLVTMPVDGSHAVAFGVAGAARVPGSAQGSAVSYPGVMPSSTIGFTAGSGMVKEQIVLSSPDAPDTWIFPLDLTGLHAQAGPGGDIQFADQSGKVLAHVPHGFMSDSNIDPHSGDGVTSYGVDYTLTTYQGRPAIRMTLDSGWLHSKDRVYPVTVDPSVSDINANGSTYVQYPFTNDYSGDNELHVGTWNGGGNKAKSFLSFGNVGSALHNDTVLGVKLGVYNTWSYSCSPRTVYVYPVTSSWSVGGNKTWPGPSVGAAVGSKSFATGWVPLGSTHSPCPSKWEGITLNQAGTNLVNGWTHGTRANNGLALGASTSDSYAWKKFASQAASSGNPFLAITYTPDGASYKLASRTPVVPVTPSQNGKIAVRVTNTGASTWTPTNGYEISYRAYDSRGHLVANHPVFTAMPTTVAPGGSATVNLTVNALAAGSYIMNFDMFSGANGSSPVSFSSQGIQPFATVLYVPQPPPTVSAVYPPTGYVAPTLAPQLSTVASGGGTVTYSFTVTCKPLPDQACVANSITSGSITAPYWTIPRAKMQWNTTYQWSVTATVNGASTTVGPVSLTTEVPQPDITSGLGASSERAYDPLSGNYTTSATDAAVAAAGPPLQVARTYNSMDPRKAGAFGAGWTTAADAALQSDNDGTGNVTVTAPDGHQLRFGRNGDGNYAAPMGSTDVLVHNSDGTWTLRDASGYRYIFASAGQLTSITDQNGLAQTFTTNAAGQVTSIANPVSGRTLTLGWSTPAGAAHPHVASVTTQAPASGQSALQWTYSYTGDELTSVCAPTGGCTQYTYGSGSPYMAGVLDSGPRSYWQLGEASGATTATDEVDVNLGTTNATYHNVTLGTAGPLAGSSETAATFNGTNSYVTLPNNLMTDSTDVTIELWFKTTSTAGGVLFGYSRDPITGTTSGHYIPALYVGTDGKLHGEIGAVSAANAMHSPGTVTDGAWHHAVITASGDSQSLYLDGTLAGTLAGHVIQLDMVHDTIGAGWWASGYPAAPPLSVGYFNGTIGQVAVYPHPLGQPAIARHYALGTAGSAELTQVTLPSGNVSEQASYDPGTARLASYTDPRGGQWTISEPIATGNKASSDALGDVTDHVTVADPAGRQESYGYDMLNGSRLVDRDNGVDPEQSYGYDQAGFLTSAVDQDGNLACFTNDSHGNVLARTWYPVEPASLPGGGTGTAPACSGATSSAPDCFSTGAACTSFYTYATYNAANPLDPHNDKMTGSADGRSASASDTTYRTKYAYNTVGQLISTTTPPTSDFPSGRTALSGYSTGTEAGYGGGTIPAGLLLSKTTPGGAVTSYQYYADGDLAKETEPSGRYTVYTYDALGRPTASTVYTTSFPSGEQTSYTYTVLGKQATVTHPAVTNQVTGVTHTDRDTYTYDDDGNELSLTQSDLTGGDPSRTTSYTYNDHGEIATQTDPGGATTGGDSQDEGASSANPQGATTSYDYDDFGNVTARTDPNGNVYRYTYNEYNKPLQETLYTSSDSQANPTADCSAPATQDDDGGCDLVLNAYTYDPAGLLAATTDAMGRITNYTYDHNQDLIAVTKTDPVPNPSIGRQTLYTYDGAGNLAAQTVSAMSGGAVGTSTVTEYTIDAAGRMIRQVSDPTPEGVSDSGYANRSVSYTYNADDYVTSQTTGSAAEGGTSVTNFDYDTAGDQISQTVVNGGTNLKTTWTYGQNGQPLTMVTPAGNTSGATPANYTTSYAYDSAGNMVTQTGPPVSVRSYGAQTPVTTRPVTSYGYDTFGDQTQVKDPNGNVTVTGYDGGGRVASVTQPAYTPPGASSAIIATTGYAYDEDGNLTQVTDPKGSVTSYTYDALGDVTSLTQPLLPNQSASGVWTYAYDADGEQLSATDPLGKTSQGTYDYFGQQATATDPLNHTTRFDYDYLGDPVKATSPEGVVVTGSYDHLGELTASSDALGDTAKYQYGYAGQRTYAHNPDGTFTQFGYDQAGNLTSQTDYPASAPGQATVPLRAESFGYDPDGNLVSARDWNGNTTTYAYNAANELVSQVQPATSVKSITTGYGYDAAGNRTAVTGGNGNITWTTYNTWGLPESVIEPATPAAPGAADRTWTTGYDADGRAVSVSQPGGVSLSYGYGPLGNLVSQSGSGAGAATPAQTLGYDLDGRLTSATAPGGTDTFTYYDNGQLHTAAGPSGTSAFTYNGDGQVVSRTGPGGTTSYTYDTAGRLAHETDPLTTADLTFGYNADSQPVSVAYSTGGTAGPVQAFGYDSLHRLTSDVVTSASDSVLASESYGYDADGNLTSQATGGLMSHATTAYGYDLADRLISATVGSSVTSYGYDDDGNLTRNGGTTSSYNAQDQLVSSASAAGTTSYGYTLSGALASVSPPGGSAQAYTSNAYGQLATAPGGLSYGYDALGRLVTRGSGSSPASMSYLGTGSVLASDGTRNYSYTPSGAMTATGVPGQSAYATMSDQHGDVAATFSPAPDAAGLAGYTTYSAYGVASQSGYRPDAGFQGGYTDPSTGLVMMGARWYNPATGTFTSNDTISGSPLPLDVDGSPYGYGDGNPLTNTDPTGHSWIPCYGTQIGTGGIGIQIGTCPGGSSGGSGGGQTQLPGRCWYGYCGPLSLQEQTQGAYLGAQGWGNLSYGLTYRPPSGGGGGGGGGQDGGGPPSGSGPCTIGCGPTWPAPPKPRPVPPPPPQDCFATGTCTAPPVPGQLLHGQWITNVVHDVTDLSQLPPDAPRIIEKAKNPDNNVRGTKPGDNGNTGSGSPGNSNPPDGLGPLLPFSPTPGDGNNKNTRKLAKDFSDVVAPALQTLLNPVVNGIAGALADALTCATHPQLAACLRTIANVAAYAIGVGEEAAAVRGLQGLADRGGAAAAEEAGTGAARFVVSSSGDVTDLTTEAGLRDLVRKLAAEGIEDANESVMNLRDLADTAGTEGDKIQQILHPAGTIQPVSPPAPVITAPIHGGVSLQSAAIAVTMTVTVGYWVLRKAFG